MLFYNFGLPHLAATGAATGPYLSDDQRRIVHVLVMLAIITVLFIVGMSTPRDWAVGIGNARRIAGVGGSR